MATIRRSIAYSLADSYLALPLQLVGTMIMARLLTPAETGVFAVAAVFSAFASTFRDFGVAEYLIQEPELKAEHIRASLTVNIAISWLMGLLLFFGAPFAADFYRSEGIGQVMRVLAINFVLIPFGAVTMAYFRRELNFKPIFIAGLLSNLVAFTVATLCALQGLGYMSLAWSSVAGIVTTVATSVWFRPKNFPKWPGTHGIGRVIQFGKFASGIYIVGQLGKGAPEAIIGRANGLVEVALFSRSSGLVELFNRTVIRAIYPVCLPYFAKGQRESGSVANGYLICIAYLTAVGWPFLAFLGIGAYAAVRLVYGTQWIEAVPLSQILCGVAAVELIHYLSKEALLAIGDARTGNRLQIVTQSSRILALAAVVPFGISGVCWALLCASIFNLAVAQYTLGRVIGLQLTSVISTSLPSIYITLCTVAPTAFWAVFEGVSEANYIAFGLWGSAVTTATWLLSLKLFRHPLWTEILNVAAWLTSKLRISR